MCTWINSACKKECVYRQLTEGGCEAELDCMWNILLGECNRLCDILDKTSCLTATLCKWNIKSQTCRRKCQYRYRTESNCTKDPQCAWDVNTGKCRDQCVGYTNEGDQSGCRADSACYWNATDSVCYEQCQTRYPLPEYSAKCQADQQCMWDAQNRQCKRTCTLIADSTLCGAETTMCHWRNNVCQMNCPFIANDTAYCRLFDRCMWDFGANTCRRRCGEESSTSVCNTDSMCVFDSTQGNICRIKCTDMWGVPQCNADYRCEWNSSTTPNACAYKCEYRYSTAAPCMADSSCFWDGTRCLKACDRLPTTTACTALSVQCEWATACRRKCSYKYANDEFGCIGNDNCMWN
jgi:hypothetical protein